MASGDADCSKKNCPDLLNVGQQPSGVESLLLLKKKAPPPPGPDQHATYRVPTSSVLDRVRSFLPRMREAEAALQRRVAQDGAESVSIETDDSERAHIELNLGVCELDSDAGSDSDSDGDSDSSDGGESRDAPVGPVTAANLRLPGGRLVTELTAPAAGGDEQPGQ